MFSKLDSNESKSFDYAKWNFGELESLSRGVNMESHHKHAQAHRLLRRLTGHLVTLHWSQTTCTWTITKLFCTPKFHNFWQPIWAGSAKCETSRRSEPTTQLTVDDAVARKMRIRERYDTWYIVYAWYIMCEDITREGNPVREICIYRSFKFTPML